jgi:hypothetical protein
LADPKDVAWGKAVAARDKEFNQRDKEIKKWKELYSDWEDLLKKGDTVGAAAKNKKLNKQGQVVSGIMGILDGKLEAMTALQAAATINAAQKRIDKLIDRESAQFLALIDEFNPGFLGGIFKKKGAAAKNAAEAFAKAFAIYLNIVGKKEIKDLL